MLWSMLLNEIFVVLSFVVKLTSKVWQHLINSKQQRKMKKKTSSRWRILILFLKSCCRQTSKNSVNWQTHHHYTSNNRFIFKQKIKNNRVNQTFGSAIFFKYVSMSFLPCISDKISAEWPSYRSNNMKQQRIISQQLSSLTWAIFGLLSNIYKEHLNIFV